MNQLAFGFESVCELILTIVAIIPLAFSIRSRYLVLRRDLIVISYLLQAIIYVHIAPWLDLGQLGPDMWNSYFTIQVAALFLFELPILGIYLFLWRHTRKKASHAMIRIHPIATGILSLACAGLCAAFAYAVVASNLLFYRIGSEQLIQRLTAMDWKVLIAYRSVPIWGKILLPLLAVLTVASGPGKSWAKLALGILVVTMGVFYAVNSREALVMLALEVAAVLIPTQPALLKQTVALAANRRFFLVVSIITLLYTYRVAMNARETYANGEIGIAVMNPWNDRESGFADDASEAIARLNGVDLAARVYVAAQSKGYAWGTAWWAPVAGVILPVFDRAAANELKLSMNVSAKKYFIHEYTGLRVLDLPSSGLNDLIGNFGLLGLFPGALVVAAIAYFGARLLSWPPSYLGLLTGILCASVLVSFEQDFITLLTDSLRQIPMLVVLTLLPIMSIRMVRNGQPGSPDAGWYIFGPRRVAAGADASKLVEAMNHERGRTL